MSRIALGLSIIVGAALAATPALSDWTARQTDDGHGTQYFLATATSDTTKVELFCNGDGVVNFSLIWPDRDHPNADLSDDAAEMTITTDAGATFSAKSYYWAAGRGVLILDFGKPGQVHDIAAAIGGAQSEITIAVSDAAKGIDKTVTFAAEGAEDAMKAYLDWCQQPAE